MSDGARSAGRLALVLGGGGARGAYQIGLLRFLARHRPDLRVPIVTGVSAGAINAAQLAANPGSFAAAVADMERSWTELEIEDVVRSDAAALVPAMFKWALRLVSGGHHLGFAARGLMDTSPLRDRLARTLAGDEPEGVLRGVAENLAAGRLDAVGITTTDFTTGQSITWVQSREPIHWERPHRLGVPQELRVAHVLASAALPFAFPAVRVGDHWHGDGGIRLTAPLSPALQMGADRLLAVSTRYARSREESDEEQIAGYPPPAQVAGVLMNAIFLDMLDFDARNLQRINDLIDTLPPGDREGLRPVDLLVLRPSEDLGKLAGRFELRLPGFLRFLTRGLGTRETKSPDWLSMLLFEPGYTRYLIELGERDAEARGDELLAFVDDSAPPAPA